MPDVTPPTALPSKPEKTPRSARLAEALRANLARRKAQQRIREKKQKSQAGQG
jgi:hypothetical protein